MDEIMPAIIFLIMIAKPQKLMRIISLVENFCLPLILTNGQMVEYAMRTLEGAGTIVAAGFCDQKKVVFGVVGKDVRVIEKEY